MTACIPESQAQASQAILTLHIPHQRQPAYHKMDVQDVVHDALAATDGPSNALKDITFGSVSLLPIQSAPARSHARTVCARARSQEWLPSSLNTPLISVSPQRRPIKIVKKRLIRVLFSQSRFACNPSRRTVRRRLRVRSTVFGRRGDVKDGRVSTGYARPESKLRYHRTVSHPLFFFPR